MVICGNDSQGISQRTNKKIMEWQHQPVGSLLRQREYKCVINSVSTWEERYISFAADYASDVEWSQAKKFIQVYNTINLFNLNAHVCCLHSSEKHYLWNIMLLCLMVSLVASKLNCKCRFVIFKAKPMLQTHCQIRQGYVTLPFKSMLVWSKVQSMMILQKH